MMKRRFAILLGLAIVTGSSLTASEGERGWATEQVGVRIGSDLDEVVSMSLVEAYGTFLTPWGWTIGEKFRTDLIAEAAIGGISGGSEIGLLAKAGAGFKFSWGTFPVTARVTISPTLLSRSSFDGWDVGGHFHFTTAGDIVWQFARHWSVGYHIQHSSNANLNHPNPGIDIHALAIGYHF